MLLYALLPEDDIWSDLHMCKLMVSSQETQDARHGRTLYMAAMMTIWTMIPERGMYPAVSCCRQMEYTVNNSLIITKLRRSESGSSLPGDHGNLRNSSQISPVKPMLFQAQADGEMIRVSCIQEGKVFGITGKEKRHNMLVSCGCHFICN